MPILINAKIPYIFACLSLAMVEDAGSLDFFDIGSDGLWGMCSDVCGFYRPVGDRSAMLAVDFPCGLEATSLEGAKEMHGFYTRCMESRTRPMSPDASIDPRRFYEEYKESHPHCKPERTGATECRRHQDDEGPRAKPSLSYAQMITQAIRTSRTGKLTLSEIYSWIEDSFEYYRRANPVWKNSIRHNLSLNKCFKKVPREPGTRGKGGKWTLDYSFLENEELRRRRRGQRHADAKDPDVSEPSGDSSNDEKEGGFDGSPGVSPEGLMKQMGRFMASKINSNKSVNKI